MAATRLRSGICIPVLGLLCACAGQPLSNDEETGDLPQFGPKSADLPA